MVIHDTGGPRPLTGVKLTPHMRPDRLPQNSSSHAALNHAFPTTATL